jgi:hypothetical protein
MRKILTVLVAAASLAAAAVAMSSTADARWGGRGWGWGPGPVIGGFAAGAIIGGALAAPYYYPYGYNGYGPYPYYGRPCVWRRVWNGYAWVRACV